MGRDKAHLMIGNQTLIARSVGLLRDLGLPVTISARQNQDFNTPGCDRVNDTEPCIGPLGGLRSVMEAHPDSGMLVIPVDLPRLRSATLRHLMAKRDPDAVATAFRNPENSGVEPLCCIYEPTALDLIRSTIDSGQFSLRRILENSDRVVLVACPEPDELIDTDTPKSFDASTNIVPIVPSMPAIQLKIQYFAVLREERGVSEETLETRAENPAQLFQELADRHGISFPGDRLKVAINDEFTSWETPLHDGDNVVFIPPVAGG
jgi:molybdopterin-guanine dinucleotide biosynthesis protein A/molybdopterin converting factor small subunit